MKDAPPSDDPPPRRISRREFVKFLAAAGLLAGCGPAQTPIPPTPRPTDAPAPQPTTQPTDLPPTATPTSVPTSPPTATPLPTLAPRPNNIPPWPEIVRFYPEGLSRVVHTRHAGVWDGENLVPEVIAQMLDASIAELTGLNDAGEAWAAVFRPNERVGIKVNTIDSSDYWTHVPLVTAVAERLQSIGIPPEQIIIFDRVTRELEGAGFPINRDGAGVRCHGTNYQYTSGWRLLNNDVGLSNVFLSCDTLINMPILKRHDHSGLTFAMKNHFGTIDRPAIFHRPRTGQAIVELNAIPEIRYRTRLIIGDMLTVCPTVTTGWYEAVPGDGLLVSFDPLAHDRIALEVLAEVMDLAGYDPLPAREVAGPWLAACAETGLGAGDPKDIDWAAVRLG